MIRAARVPRPGGVEGVEGPPGELPWLGWRLAERQEQALVEAGVPLVDSPQAALADGATALLLREDVALLPDTVRALVAACEELEGDAGLLPEGRLGGLVDELLLGEAAPLVAVLRGGSWSPERLEDLPVVRFDPVERLMEIPVPASQFGAEAVEIPVSDRILLPMGHWLQLLWANLLGLPPFLWRRLAGRNIVEVMWRVAGGALRTRSVDPVRIGLSLGQRGKGCRVHPSAVVEASWLADDVSIGANAVVRGCVLGRGAAVEDLAVVEASVLGPGARVQRLGMLKYSVLCAGSAHAGMAQLGVLAQGASVKGGALLMDMAPGHRVQVQAGGRLVPAPLGLAGVCVGARTVVGAAVGVAPGRCLPPDLQVVADPGTLVRSVPQGISGRVSARDGRLEPVS